MAFGAVFHRNRPQWLRPLESTVYRVFGWPNIIRRLQWPHVLSMLQPGPNDTVVDLGAGSMQYTVELAKQACGRVIAVDLLVPAGSAEWARSHNLTALNADALKLPFANHSIDRVVVSSLLQAVPDPDRMLAECHRVLKPNGFLVLIVPNHYRYIPKAYAWFGRRLKRFLRLPDAFNQFVHELNRCFHVSRAARVFQPRRAVGAPGPERIHHRPSSIFSRCAWDVAVGDRRPTLPASRTGCRLPVILILPVGQSLGSNERLNPRL